VYQVEVMDAEDMCGVEKKKVPTKKTGGEPKWKQESENLRAAMRACRDVAKETSEKK
jgi:hypothetical protein